MCEVIFLLKFSVNSVLKDKKTSQKNSHYFSISLSEVFWCPQEEQAAKLKAEKIRVALEKCTIKEV